MGKRKSIPPSMRWQVFARDGFRCRYCGCQAGEDGVDLVIDHVVSVKDGGDNAMDNLATACRTCNSGKGAKSLSEAPTPQEVVDRIREQVCSLEEQAEAMKEAYQSRVDLRQEAVNMACQAYRVKTFNCDNAGFSVILRLSREFGADAVFDWLCQAGDREVSQWEIGKYLNGCARNTREEARCNGGN